MLYALRLLVCAFAAEQSSSAGVLIQDKLQLLGGGFPVVFGCETRETGEIFSQEADGIMGLGKSAVSVVNQVGCSAHCEVIVGHLATCSHGCMCICCYFWGALCNPLHAVDQPALLQQPVKLLYTTPHVCLGAWAVQICSTLAF